MTGDQQSVHALPSTPGRVPHAHSTLDGAALKSIGQSCTPCSPSPRRNTEKYTCRPRPGPSLAPAMPCRAMPCRIPPSHVRPHIGFAVAISPLETSCSQQQPCAQGPLRASSLRLHGRWPLAVLPLRSGPLRQRRRRRCRAAVRRHLRSSCLCARPLADHSLCLTLQGHVEADGGGQPTTQS